MGKGKKRKIDDDTSSPNKSEGIINSEMGDELGCKVFNDSVHGHISLHPLLVKFIDTPQFQRLRNLKQLGVANYVYPAAGHCRFEHSLGTCYLAGELVRVLFQREKPQRPDEERKQLMLCVQLAALCHDLGHGPFSHTWEEVVRGWGDSWKHEQSSIEMLDYLISENKLLGELEYYKIKDEIDFVKNLIEGKPPPKVEPKNMFLYEIVSNSKTGIDVDKWDYFLRDGQQLNLRITFDYKRILELCVVLELEDGKTTIAFQDKTMTNLYDMYRVRSDLHLTAYRHKVVVNIERMLVDGFVLAGKAGFTLKDGTKLKEAHKKPQHLCQLSDHVFYDILYSNDERFVEAKNIFKRILTRKLYTLVYRKNFEVSEVPEDVTNKKFVKDIAENLEKDLGKEFKVSEFYLDLYQENDPIKKVSFYKKDGKVVKTLDNYVEEARKEMSPQPFQLLDKAVFQLLVFHTKEKQSFEENELNEKRKQVEQKVCEYKLIEWK